MGGLGSKMKQLLKGFNYFDGGTGTGAFVEGKGDFVVDDARVLRKCGGESWGEAGGKGEGKRVSERDVDKVEEMGYIVPPVMDMHIHGGWGVEFGSTESFFFLEQKLRAEGIYYAVPTLLNSKWGKLDEIVPNFAEYKEKSRSDAFPFMRIEGPFISDEMRGGQDQEFVLAITTERVEKLLKYKEHLRMFTYAPELEGSDQLVKVAIGEGMIPSVGHSNATYSDFLKACKKQAPFLILR
jgi:N-acetylglucosamine-6-phosphate deacetylase